LFSTKIIAHVKFEDKLEVLKKKIARDLLAAGLGLGYAFRQIRSGFSAVDELALGGIRGDDGVGVRVGVSFVHVGIGFAF
jgi:hypothetical protein